MSLAARRGIPVGGALLVLGLLAAKDVLARQLKGEPLDLAVSLEVPLYIPETISPNRLLETFRETRRQVALIVNEYGDVQGLVTLTDVMEAIVGDIPVMLVFPS